MVRIGVLALQGDVAEHSNMIAGAGAEPIPVKQIAHLESVDGLILPGGESTTIGKLLRRFELLPPLRSRVRAGFPVYGTCAGMILLADEVEDAATDQPTIGGMDISVRRNAFGRQRESFEVDLSVPSVGTAPIHALFIRAPVITRRGPHVDVLARIDGERIVAARQGNMLVSSFHPELTGDDRLHRYFIHMVQAA